MDAILQFFTEPLSYVFIQRGMLALVLVGGISAVIGCFVVIRGMSFFGDALAHTVLPGVALSYTAAGGTVGSNLFVGGLGAGIISALVIAYLTRNERLKEDTAVGLVFVTMFALGIAIISTQGSYSIDLAHILFGSINGISQGDLEIMAIMGAIVLVTIGIFYKQFVIISFDLSLAHTLKLRVEFLRVLLLILIAVTIVASLQAVGIALMLALLITPAATARLMVRRLHIMIVTSVIIGIVSGMAGFYLSYYLDIPSGASIVLTMSTIFAIVFVGKRIQVSLQTTSQNKLA
ncbi:metal ABC transporter permease [Phototrophicus methaneseepsis]|uniref:metal ABC transporter permease n=1 Tax=Phototrophicus methaneseepsis TaxID=2710758 RepID=UPI001E5AE34D|nr:metal ABC transporter permease [Phototrophicus methaneseepsis]